MEEMTFELILSDGTKIDGTVNGNNLVTTKSISSIDDNDLIGATLDGVELQDTTCCNLWQDMDGTHIILRTKTEYELGLERMISKLEYLAMMTDVDID